MKYPLYSIRDLKAGYGFPNADQSDATAIRGFCFGVNNGGMMNYCPKDFDLFKVGEFDTETGVLIPCQPQFIYSGVNAVEKEVND